MAASEDPSNSPFRLHGLSTRLYLSASLVVVAASCFGSYWTCSWSWVQRSGGVLVLFGVLLSLRKVFRLGARHLADPDQPSTIRGNQLNIRYLMQQTERARDDQSQRPGIVLMVIGTILGAWGDLLLEMLLPLSGKCGP